MYYFIRKCCFPESPNGFWIALSLVRISTH